MTTELSIGLKVVSTLSDCLKAIEHPTRLKIAQFCSKPRHFTEIILKLKLNPASFKFHIQVLVKCELVEKVTRGVYKTTKLGNLVLELVNQASTLSTK